MSNVLIAKRQQKISTEIKTCASVLVEKLVQIGVDSIFGYPGASILSIYNELARTKRITHYLVRHEQAALHAAEGYASVSGKTGVVLVTSGPGFTNTITGMANAYADFTPLVILAGDVAKEHKTGKVFQNVDMVSMAESCTKKIYSVTKNDDIVSVIDEAFETANSGVKGPVLVVLPRNVLESEYIKKRTIKKVSEKPLQYSDKDVDKFVSLVNNAQKPLLLVGGGAANASDEITKLVRTLNCPVVSTLMGIGIFPSEDEKYLGMIGMNGTYTANTALANCDLLITLGASFSDRSTCKNRNFAKHAKIISVNLQKNYQKCELMVQYDVKLFLKSVLNQTICKNNCAKWEKQIQTLKEEGNSINNDNTCLHSSYVLKTISEFTKDKEPIVVTDVGQHQMLTAQFFNFNKPAKFITSGGLGTMGFGLPAAIGAHIANPNNLVLNITGDGSYQMNLQELATCREHNIPIKIIIMNNGYLGMVRQMQEKIYNNRYQVEMTNPDFTKIAEAYDLFAVRVSRKEELIPALEKAISHNGTAIVDIKIDSYEEI